MLIYGLTLVVQLICGVFLFDHIGRNKKNFLTVFICWYIPFMGIQALSLYVLDFLPNSVYTAVKMALCFVIIIVFYEVSLKRSLLMCLEFTLLQMVVEVPSILLVGLLFEVDINDIYSPVNGSVYISAGRVLLLNLFVLAVISAVFIHIRRKDKMLIQKSDLLLIAVFDLLMFFFLLVYYRVNRKTINETDNTILLAFQALLFVLMFSEYYNTLYAGRLALKNHELELLKEQQDSNRAYCKLADEKYEEISRLRREITKRLTDMKALAVSGGTDEANAIMEDINNTLGSVRAVAYCENKTVNAVLTVKLNSAEAALVPTQVILKDCGELDIDDYDLCSLVSNLYDNALECCLSMKNRQDAFIEIKSALENDYFILKVVNPCEGEAGLSTKKGSGHGYGLKIVKDICQRNDGSFIMKNSGGRVSAIACLKAGGRI